MSVTQDQNRQRILDATEDLLKRAGRDEVTIRAVAEAAGVQLPTLYRLFGDKVGLLEAVVERGFLRYMSIDPIPGPAWTEVDLLRRGWDIHVRFGVENPELYSLMYGDFSMRKDSPALRLAQEGLKGLFDRLARAGLLRLPQHEAMLTAFASASGAVLALQFLPPEVKRETFLANAQERMVRAVVLSDEPSQDNTLGTALAIVRGNVSSLASLTVGEQGLLAEWLERVQRFP